jgi:hypothetical protein
MNLQGTTIQGKRVTNNIVQLKTENKNEKISVRPLYGIWCGCSERSGFNFNKFSYRPYVNNNSAQHFNAG